MSAHYVALGHIHKPQRIPGRCPIWYAGSPFALDFGETHGEHSVLLIEAEAGQPAHVQQVPLRSGRALTTIRGRSLQLEQLAGTTGDDFLRVIVEEAPSPGLSERVRDLFPNAVDVIVAQPGDTTTKARTIDPGELRDPRTQFQRYLRERGVDGDELEKLFGELLEEEYASPSA